MDLTSFYEESDRIHLLSDEYIIDFNLMENSFISITDLNNKKSTVSFIPLAEYSENTYRWLIDSKELYEYIKEEYNGDFSWIRPFFERNIILDNEKCVFIAIMTKLLMNTHYNLIIRKKDNKTLFLLIDLGIKERWNYHLFFRVMFGL